MCRTPSLLLASLVCAFGGLELSTIPAHTGTVDYLSYHGGNLSSDGLNANEQQMTTANVNVNTFGKLFSVNVTDTPNTTGIPTAQLPGSSNYTAVDGQVTAQPVVKTGVNITTGASQGVHDVVFVATEMDSLFALDANTGTVLWKDSFLYNASGNPNPVNANIPVGVTAGIGGGPELISTDLVPWVGIIGTPAIDGTNGFIYFVAKTREIAAGDQAHPHYVNTLHKVRLSDGLDASAVIADTTLQTSNSTYTYNSGPYVVGAGGGSINVGGQSRVYFNSVRQMFRPAVELYNGRVYLGSGSHGDNQPYHGWILSYDASTLVCNGAWCSTPNSGEGEAGVWQGGGGVVIDSNGYIYFETGNGGFDGTNTSGVLAGLDANGFPQSGDYGDCVLKLMVDPTTTQGNQGTNKNGWGLVTVDYFSPFNNHALDSVDEDLGSAGPTILPDSAGSTAHPHLLVATGKQGNIYVIDRDTMGKFGTTDNVVQTFSSAVNGCLSVCGYFNGRLYIVPSYSNNPMSWPLSSATITTSAGQTVPVSIGFPGCSPNFSANGTSNGIMWLVDKQNTCLRAYDASNIATELWDSGQNNARDSMGGAIKFVCTTPVNGHVYVGTDTQLLAYGNFITYTAPPTAPTGLTATPTGPSTIQLVWTDTAQDENGFRVERSNDGTNFTEISSVGMNVTTFGDTGLSSQETYYYRVRATNTFNTLSFSSYSNIANATTPSTGSQLPVSLYHFDEGVGATTIDSVSGNNGTLIGSPLPAWISPGRIGNAALSFSGNGQYLASGQSAVQVTNDLSPTLGGTSSLLFWIKTTQTGNNSFTNAPAVTGAEQSSGDLGIAWGYLNGSGHIGVAVGSGTNLVSASPINDGQWHHIGLTRDATAGTVNIYVDGVLSSTGTLETGSKTSPYKLIGALSDVGSDGITLAGKNFLNAQLDDVQIFNQIVSAATVAAIALPPAAATNLTVTPASETELDLSWTDNATNESEYDVYRSINGATATLLAQLPANTVSYADTGLGGGTLYSYYVVALNSSGSSTSNTASATTPLPPTTPSNASITYLSPTEIDMQWTDNATNELGYTILRRIGTGNFSQAAALPANSTTFQDTNVTPATSYDYHIEAYNVAGYSDFTGLTVTTPAQSQYLSYLAPYNLSDTSPTADPNNIGVPNLLAYAFNLNPTVSAASGLPQASAQNGFLTISFVERIPPTDLTYKVQVSGDMVTWNSGPSFTTVVSVTPIDSATQMVTVRDNTSMSSGAKRFIRVSIGH